VAASVAEEEVKARNPALTPSCDAGIRASASIGVSGDPALRSAIINDE
jgi:hypothetical protein